MELNLMNNNKLERLRNMSYKELKSYCFQSFFDKNTEDVEFGYQRSDLVEQFLNEEPELQYLIINEKSKQHSKQDEDLPRTKFDYILSRFADYIENGKIFDVYIANKEIRAFNKGKAKKDRKSLVKPEYPYTSNSCAFEKEIRTAHLREAKFKQDEINKLIEDSDDPVLISYTNQMNDIHKILSDYKKFGTEIKGSNFWEMCMKKYKIKQKRQEYWFKLHDKQAEYMIEEMRETTKTAAVKIENDKKSIDNFDDSIFIVNVDLDMILNELSINELDQKIFKMKVKGYTSKQIAETLVLKEPYVSKHLKKIKNKIKDSKKLETIE